jgi:hypothetical protein
MDRSVSGYEIPVTLIGTSVRFHVLRGNADPALAGDVQRALEKGQVATRKIGRDRSIFWKIGGDGSAFGRWRWNVKPANDPSPLRFFPLDGRGRDIGITESGRNRGVGPVMASCRATNAAAAARGKSRGVRHPGVRKGTGHNAARRGE